MLIIIRDLPYQLLTTGPEIFLINSWSLYQRSPPSTLGHCTRDLLHQLLTTGPEIFSINSWSLYQRSLILNSIAWRDMNVLLLKYDASSIEIVFNVTGFGRISFIYKSFQGRNMRGGRLNILYIREPARGWQN